MIETIRLIVPQMFSIPLLRDWLIEVAAKNSFPEPEKALDFLAQECNSLGCQVLVGLEDEKLAAFSVTLLPGSPLMRLPQIVVAYNEGSLDLSHAMQKEVIAFVRSAGYDRCLGMNNTGKPDEVFARNWRQTADTKVVGSMVECVFKE